MSLGLILVFIRTSFIDNQYGHGVCLMCRISQGQLSVITRIGTEKYGRISGITGVVTTRSKLYKVKRKINGTGEIFRYSANVVMIKCRYGQVLL